MADASRGLGYLHLVNVAQWHISDDNYVAARVAIINAHHKHPIAAIGSAAVNLWQAGLDHAFWQHLPPSPEAIQSMWQGFEVACGHR